MVSLPDACGSLPVSLLEATQAPGIVRVIVDARTLGVAMKLRIPAMHDPSRLDLSTHVVAMWSRHVEVAPIARAGARSRGKIPPPLELSAGTKDFAARL
jgi:hypothetical protein